MEGEHEHLDPLQSAAFDPVGTGLCLLLNGTIVRANDAWLQSIGRSAETVIGQSYDSVAPDRSGLIQSLCAGALGQPVALPPGSLRTMNLGGSESPHWDERATPVRLNGSVGLLLASTPQGLDNRAKAEHARAEREAVYRAVFENTRAPMQLLEAIRGPLGNVVDWSHLDANDAVVGLQHGTRDQLVNRRLSITDAGTFEYLLEGYGQVLTTGEPWRYDARVGNIDYTVDVVRVDSNRIVSSSVDITSLAQTNAALRQSEHQLQQLVTNMPIAAALLDRDMRYLAFSQRFATDNDVGVSSLLGRSHYDVFPQTPELRRNSYQRCLNGSSEECAEEAVLRPDGKVDCIRWEVRPWCAADGTIGGLAIFSALVTDEKLATETLLGQKELLAITLRSIGDGVITTDESSRVTLFNKVAEQLTGWKAADALGRPLVDVFRIVHEDTGKTVSNPMDDALQEGVTSGLAAHTELIERDGTRRPIADSAAPIRDEKGSISGAILVFRDQTVERRAEQALKRSRAELLTLIERLPIGVFVTHEHKILYANAAFLGYLQQTDISTLLGHSISDFAASKTPSVPSESEHTLIALDGSSVTLECSAARDIEFEGRDAQLWVCRDLSQFRAMQARLIHHDRLASVGMLAAGVAHEINNPLAYVMGSLDFLDAWFSSTRSLPTGNDLKEALGALSDARDGARRVKAIVRDIKAFSCANNDVQVTLELRQVLDSAIGMATNEFRLRARLARDYGPTPPVLASEARLGQVFLNLIINAAHAIPEGHPEKNEICVVLRTDSQGRAVVEVQDTGCGIPEHLRNRIFDPFFTTKGSTGTGLGLAITRNTVLAMGGEITIESRGGGGTIARVTLPSTGLSPPKSAPPLIRAEGRRARLLVIDDEPNICRVLQRMLGKDHDVVTETNAELALLRIERGEHFDVIFCDMMMPIMTGITFYEQLLARDAQQAKRVVFTTGGTFTPKAESFLKQVPNTRLDKPFDLDEVRTMVALRLS